VVADRIQALDRKREDTAPPAGEPFPADVSDAAGAGEAETPSPWDDQ
jgi:hypothetical protein